MVKTKRRILIIDDEPLVKECLYEALTKKNYLVEIAEKGQTALSILKTHSFDLVITDIRIPDIDGMEILKTAKAIDPNLGVIVITAYGTIENAVEAMKVGAFDYITKPFPLDVIELAINKYFNYKKLLDENFFLKNELTKVHSFNEIIGKSKKMQKIFEIVDAVAESKATVLIHGASGTGKELIARAIHYRSPRRNGPFIKTNCAALPESLAESELFGHEKGAFTGAIKNTKGRFEMADGGTLLLDEISEMSMALQAKLLRVLQEKEFEKVGNPESVFVDIRIIATTNKDLKAEVENGCFRKDLYYRLNVVPIQLPTLQEHKEDIPLLAEYFLNKYAKENNKSITGFADEVIDLFLECDWPGNIRELEHTIERAVVISKDPLLRMKHFKTLIKEVKLAEKIKIVNVGDSRLNDIEKLQIMKVLNECGGNQTRAAAKLGISTRTLRNKLKKYQSM